MDEYESLLWRAKKDLERELRAEEECREMLEAQRKRVQEARRAVDELQESRSEAMFQILKRLDQKMDSNSGNSVEPGLSHLNGSKFHSLQGDLEHSQRNHSAVSLEDKQIESEEQMASESIVPDQIEEQGSHAVRAIRSFPDAKMQKFEVEAASDTSEDRDDREVMEDQKQDDADPSIS